MLSVIMLLLFASIVQAHIVDLAWDAPKEGDSPLGYTMYRKINTRLFELIDQIDPTTFVYSDVQVGNGTTCWHVTAWNSDGESAPSNEVCLFFRGKAPKFRNLKVR